MQSIILLQPKLGFYDLVARNIPVGLLSAASMLDKDYAVVIIDQRLPGWETKLAGALRGKPLCAGLTVQTGEQIRHALEISRLVKSTSETPVVWGGIHPTLLPRQTVDNPNIDIVVQGEGELTFRALADALAHGHPLSEIKGIAYKEHGSICVNPPQDIEVDLNSQPPLPYHTIDFAQYAGHAVQNFEKNIFYIETGRGCPYSCTYCYNSGLGRRKRRALSAEKIIERILHLKQFTPVDGVTFIDDSFFTEKDRLFAFTRLLRENGLRIKWNCEANISDIRHMTGAELKELESSGLTWLALGVESGSDKILRDIRKGLRLEDVRTVSSILSGYGFYVRYNFMSGYIGETTEDLKQTTRLILELLRNNPRASIRGLSVAVPYPKTEYYRSALEHGLAEPGSLEEWSGFISPDWASRIPWLDRKNRALRKLLYIASLFIDNKARINVSFNVIGALARAAALVYRPVARWRFRHTSAFLPLEVIVYDAYRALEKLRAKP